MWAFTISFASAESKVVGQEGRSKDGERSGICQDFLDGALGSSLKMVHAAGLSNGRRIRAANSRCSMGAMVGVDMVGGACSNYAPFFLRIRGEGAWMICCRVGFELRTTIWHELEYSMYM